MPRRKVPLVTGCYYHVYNRGHNRAPIFFEAQNYDFFLSRLWRYVLRGNARLIAYVLMPNHYHLLLHAVSTGLSRGMQLFGISYAKAINARFKRTGALFDGPFRAKLVDRNEYLIHLSRYVHLNPVRAKLVSRPQEWTYSSYGDYLGVGRDTWLEPTIVLDQFESREEYRQFVESYVEIDREAIAQLLFE